MTHDIKMERKIKVYNEFFLPLLTRTQVRHLQHVQQIQREKKMPHVEVLKWAGTVSVLSLNTASQLRWTGRVRHVLYGEFSDGKRKPEWQKLHHKDFLKHHVKNAAINDDTCEEDGLDWNKFRQPKKSHIQRMSKHFLPEKSAHRRNRSGRYYWSVGLVDHKSACQKIMSSHCHHRKWTADMVD